MPGQGEVFFVIERARARSCASTNCRAVTILDVGKEIVSLRFESGQTIAGDETWIKFSHEGGLLYVHRSLLSDSPPVIQVTEEPTASPELSPTAAETGVVARAVSAQDRATPTEMLGQGKVFYVRERVRARPCPSTDCRSLEFLDIGAKIVAWNYQSGQLVAGDDTWVQFLLNGAQRFVHRSSLSETAPMAPASEEPTESPEDLPSATEIVPPTKAATTTESPAPTQTEMATLAATATDIGDALLTIETQNNLNARVRSCPSTSCDIVGRLSPGDQIQAISEVKGENINGIDLWAEFVFEGEIAYVHGGLVEPAN